MSDLITCGKVLAALTNRLKTASPDELDAVRKALGISDKDEDTVVNEAVFDKDKSELKITMSNGETVTADFCGWQPKQPCEYFATLQIVTERDECSGVFTRTVWGFHPDDLRDPAADVRVEDCKGNVVGYVYSTSEGLHTAPIYATKEDGSRGEVLGYGLISPTVRYYRNSDCGCQSGISGVTAAPKPADTGTVSIGTGVGNNPPTLQVVQNPKGVKEFWQDDNSTDVYVSLNDGERLVLTHNALNEWFYPNGTKFVYPPDYIEVPVTEAQG